MNPIPFIWIAVCSGFGYLANGADGAIWGATIMGSIVAVVSAVDLRDRGLPK